MTVSKVGNTIKLLDAATGMQTSVNIAQVTKVMNTHFVGKGGGIAGGSSEKLVINKVSICTPSGSVDFDLRDVTNQPTWTANPAGLAIAVDAIAAWL